MRSLDTQNFSFGGIPPGFYSREYFLSESGGIKRLKRAVTSGDFGAIFHSHIYQNALKLGKPNASSFVLDVGCGRGELCFMLAYKGVRVVGIDYSADSIALCNELKRFLPKGKRKFVSFKHMDILSEPVDLKYEEYDLIYFLDVIEHLTSQEGVLALSTIHSLLRPGGKLIIHTNNMYFERYAYRAVAFVYHGWRAFTKFGTESIRAVHTPYEHLHIHYYTKSSLVAALKKVGYENNVKYVRPERVGEVKKLLPHGGALMKRPLAYLIYWFSKTPVIALLSPSVWGVGVKSWG